MSEREQHMDTDKRTGTSGQCGNTDEMRWDLGTLFPAKGDPRRPPEWLGRALLYIAIAIVLLSFCWRSWGKIEYLIIDVVISLFLALAVEPVVIPLVKHGWKRSFASIFALLMLGVLLCVMFGLFGNLFVQQVIALCNGLPALYQQICDFVAQYTDFKLPEINSLGGEILKNIQTSWVTDFAGTAISTVSGFFSFLLNLMTVIMTTFYISAAGPKLRRAACQWMAPSAQRRFLFVWTVSQTQISSFLFSRAILAVLNAFFTSICLMALHVPYWMPLALFCGVVSQFIPMLGTYIGGALPVLFAWGSCGLWQAVAVVAFICVYQQIENLIFAPKISRRTMDVNDAVAFLAVLAFGSRFAADGRSGSGQEVEAGGRRRSHQRAPARRAARRAGVERACADSRRRALPAGAGVQYHSVRRDRGCRRIADRRHSEARVGRGRSQAAAGNRGSGRSADGSRTAGSGRVAIAGNG